MRKILYLAGALLFFCFSSIAVFAGGDELESVQETVSSEDESEDSVLFDGFQEMDYYMLLQSNVGFGVSLDYYSYGIYGNMTQTAREGEELYLSLNKRWFGNEIEPEKQTDYANWLPYHLNEHIAGFSPDLEWCITYQGYFETSTYDRMERIYRDGILISENEEKSYYNTIVGKDILCKNPETDRFLIMAEDKRQHIENLINTIWGWEGRDDKIYYGQSRFCLCEDGMLMALVKPDNRHIGIYETEECTELFEFGFEQMDADWPLEVSQIQGNAQEGWFTFSNGDKAFQFFYPTNEIVPLGEFMFNINISPDGKYCAYYTGSDLLYSTWEVLYMDNWDKFAQMLERWKKVPSGWYIKELDSGLTTYIPVKSMADVGQPPLDGKCMWIQKDKLLELFETEKISDLAETESNVIPHADMEPGIDYDLIQQKYRILEYNICTTPQDDYENMVLNEYLKEDIEQDKEMCEKMWIAAPLEIDYFTYDFNADGLDDYLVCFHGYLWSGSGGNNVRIYIQNEDKTLRMVLDITIRLEEPNMPGGHTALAVLDERIAGYYAIVLPGSNRILRYDSEKDWYEFHDGE